MTARQPFRTSDWVRMNGRHGSLDAGPSARHLSQKGRHPKPFTEADLCLTPPSPLHGTSRSVATSSRPQQ
jgi:hypothetical protein